MTFTLPKFKLTFLGNVKPERWNRILRAVDSMNTIAVSRAIGEVIFKYEHLWRTNNDVIGIFIGCMVKAGFKNWAMIHLCLNIFDSTWCRGIKEEIMGLDEEMCVPLPEMYMEHPPGSLFIANIPRRLALIIRDRVAFNMEWPKMESCFHFLMGWRKITHVVGHGWMVNYLSLHKAYVHPGF